MAEEVITGMDYKLMIAGAYSELILSYEDINKVAKTKEGGTQVLRTVASAIIPLATAKDTSIGGLSRRASTAARLGARGNSGVVVSELLRGISKGLQGKYDATSSEFGKAFQYGILHAQRVIKGGYEAPIITVAKAVAKGAYQLVRKKRPISEILTTAIAAGEAANENLPVKDAGALLMVIFLKGCLKGLDGNFVSPYSSLTLPMTNGESVPNPKEDLVRPYCVRFRARNQKITVEEMERELKEFGTNAIVERRENGIFAHIHTEHPGNLLEWAVGLGPLREIHITNMSEPHALGVNNAIMPVALIAAPREGSEEILQEAGATIIVKSRKNRLPSVEDLVLAAHSDFADSYVLLSSRKEDAMVFRQAKYLLEDRVELVLAETTEKAQIAAKIFDNAKTAKENAANMLAAIEEKD
ncbi:MAG: DAK2 domain-containing protein [Selenomonadaceae bacterium]|nr:DAK2 domain-containing protein [Selenomonadaceae bacterium]